MNIKEQMESIYRTLPLEEIPWNLERPPEVLKELIQSGWVSPCRAVDLGCGAGNYAVWLAARGFHMTGIDISEEAVEIARGRASKEDVECEFISLDLSDSVAELKVLFDFAYDWEVLHHVFPDNRERYVENVHRLLRPGGKYFSLCFSEDEPSSFGGIGKYRQTPLGTTLYFSSENELRELFGRWFHIEQLHTIEVDGKKSPHVAIAAKLSKKET